MEAGKDAPNPAPAATKPKSAKQGKQLPPLLHEVSCKPRS